MSGPEHESLPTEPGEHLLLLCEGRCPGHQGAGPVTCEGACSDLTTRWLARRLMLEEDAAQRRAARAGLLRGTLLAVIATGALLGWARQAPAAESRSTSSFALSVTDPAPVKGAARAAATVRVVPKGPYKMNLEFPLKLKASAPDGVSPRELTLTMKQVAKLTKAELVLKPEFKLPGPGRFAFKGSLRFSVCTDAQCEIKTENVTWTAVSR